MIIAIKKMNEDAMIKIDWLFDQTSLSAVSMYPYHVVGVMGALTGGTMEKTSGS